MSVVICLLLFIEVKRKRDVIKVIVKVIDGIVTSTDFFVIIINIFTTKRVSTLDSFIMESRAMRDSEQLIVGLFTKITPIMGVMGMSDRRGTPTQTMELI